MEFLKTAIYEQVVIEQVERKKQFKARFISPKSRHLINELHLHIAYFYWYKEPTFISTLVSTPSPCPFAPATTAFCSYWVIIQSQCEELPMHFWTPRLKVLILLLFHWSVQMKHWSIQKNEVWRIYLNHTAKPQHNQDQSATLSLRNYWHNYFCALVTFKRNLAKTLWQIPKFSDWG